MTNYFTDYEVYTEEDVLNLLPKGEYEAWIRDVSLKQGRNDPSKTYVILTVDVYDKNGRPHSIFQGCYFKHMLRHACSATGCLDKYESKTLLLEDDLKGKEVIAVVDIQEAQNGYKSKNIIKDFKSTKNKDQDPIPVPEKGFDDEISF